METINEYGTELLIALGIVGGAAAWWSLSTQQTRIEKLLKGAIEEDK